MTMLIESFSQLIKTI